MKKVTLYLNKLLKMNDVIVVGCSGGPDSMALLQLLVNVKEKLNLTIICAHVNHAVRTESDDEYIFVKDYCDKNNIIFEGMKIESYSKDDNFHNEARIIRYDFFDKLIKKYNAKYLMTAHHGDDLIETVLMRIVRGSTMNGYIGFNKELDRGTYKIIRPLIYVTKDEIEKYDYENNISFVHDLSNESDKYTRNRYRHHVLPFLKEEDKNVHLKFLKFSEELIKYNEFVDNLIKDAMDKVYKDNKLNLKEFNNLELLVQTKIIENILHNIYGDDLFIVNSNHIDLIFGVINSNKANASAHLPKGLVVKKTYDILTISLEDIKEDEYLYQLDDMVILPNNHIIKKISKTNNKSNYCIRLSSDEVTLPFYVRTKKAGDFIEVKNLGGRKKVKDIFIDEKIIKEERDLWPIVLDSFGNILWIPGVKKSKFDKDINEKYDIILWYERKEENYEQK